eukprot:3046743-Rhodomonas_salina.1
MQAINNAQRQPPAGCCCYNCNEVGHILPECPHPIKNPLLPQPNRFAPALRGRGGMVIAGGARGSPAGTGWNGCCQWGQWEPCWPGDVVEWSLPVGPVVEWSLLVGPVGALWARGGMVVAGGACDGMVFAGGACNTYSMTLTMAMSTLLASARPCLAVRLPPDQNCW